MANLSPEQRIAMPRVTFPIGTIIYFRDGDIGRVIKTGEKLETYFDVLDPIHDRRIGGDWWSYIDNEGNIECLYGSGNDNRDIVGWKKQYETKMLESKIIGSGKSQVYIDMGN